jgi:ABC-type long-subunit fatty acid transport system fused permease/ATPase subunit
MKTAEEVAEEVAEEFEIFWKLIWKANWNRKDLISREISGFSKWFAEQAWNKAINIERDNILDEIEKIIDFEPLGSNCEDGEKHLNHIKKQIKEFYNKLKDKR